MSKKNREDGFKEQDIYALFNDIQYNEQELDGIDVNLSDLQKRRIMKGLKKKVNRRKTSNIKRTVAAVAGAVFLLGAFTINPALAEKVPVVGSIIQIVNDRYGHYKNYDQYAQVVNKDIESNGINFTINDVLCDDSNLMITFTVKSHRNLREIAEGGKVFPAVNITRDMRINGELFSGGGGLADDFLDDYTYSGVDKIHLDPYNKLPEKFDIDLRLREVFGIKGRWDVAFTVSKEEISKNITVFEVDKKIELGNSSITIDKVSFTPINTSIVVSGKYKPSFEDEPMFNYDYWFVFDDNGNYLDNTGGGASGQDGSFYQSYYLEPLDKIPEYLTVIPCDLTPSMQGGGAIDGKPMPVKENKSRETVRPLKSNYPLELEQGDFGKLIIEDVIYEKDKTIVTYTAQGAVPPFQASALGIRDNNGDHVKKKGPVKEIREENGEQKFVREFAPVDPDKNYSFFTHTFDNYELREDLKFKIELK